MSGWSVSTLTAPLSASDLPDLIASLDGLWEADARRRDPVVRPDWPQRQAAAYLNDVAADRTAVLLAVRADDGTVAGHLVGRFREPDDFLAVPVASLESMHVRADLRGGGGGTALVRAFVAEAERRRTRRISVTAYAANEPALGFYARCGFAPASTTLHRYLAAG